MRVRLMLFSIIGRPAAAGRRMTAIATDMNAERQGQFFGQGIERPIAAAAERLVGARRNIDLHILADLGAALDFSDRRLRVVLPDQDRGLPPALPAGPGRQFALADGPRDRSAGLKILL